MQRDPFQGKTGRLGISVCSFYAHPWGDGQFKTASVFYSPTGLVNGRTGDCQSQVIWGPISYQQPQRLGCRPVYKFPSGRFWQLGAGQRERTGVVVSTGFPSLWGGWQSAPRYGLS